LVFQGGVAVKEFCQNAAPASVRGVQNRRSCATDRLYSRSATQLPYLQLTHVRWHFGNRLFHDLLTRRRRRVSVIEQHPTQSDRRALQTAAQHGSHDVVRSAEKLRSDRAIANRSE
jgi:hypothetical protein